MSNKEDKKNRRKGFIRNTAINVAQDFVNAGNPFNPGGHILGSIADGVLMEVGDRKMAKSVYNSMADQQRTAEDLLDEMFMEKTAGVRNFCAGVRMMKNPDSRKVITGALTGSRARAVKRELKDIESKKQGLNTIQKMTGKGGRLEKQRLAKAQQLQHEKDLSRAVRGRAAKGAVAVGAVGAGGKYVYDRTKQANDMLDEMFMEKTAGVEALLNVAGRKLYNLPKAAPKAMGRYKELLTGKNVAGLEQSANQAKQKFFDAGKKYDTVRKAGMNPGANPNTLGNITPGVNKQMYDNMMGQKQAYQAAKEGLQAEKNKVLATRVGTGLGAGLIAKDMYDQQKNAHDMLDNMFMEKTAGFGVKKK